MDLSFYPLTLEALDQANAQASSEALCLFIGEDERPLVGLSGLCDWRLTGALSRMLRKGLVKGEEGEAVLTPGAKLGFRKLFLFGMGPVGQGEEELAARLSERLRRIGRAGVEDAAFQIPQRLSLDLGIRTLIDEPNGPARARVFGADPAAMVRALSQAASRGASEARHERRVIKVPASHKSQPPPVRKGGPARPGPIEIPKASPLPFAPEPGKVAPEKIAADKAAAEKLAVPANLGPEQLEGEKLLPSISTTSSAELSRDETPIAPSASEPPIAPSASEPPIAPSISYPPDADVPVAPSAEPTPLPPRAVELLPAATIPASAPTQPSAQKESAVSERKPAAEKEQKELFESSSSAPRSGRALPVDYKAPRFVPPEPKPAGGKKSKRKKR